MSGLCGVFRSHPSSLPGEVVERMERAIGHRSREPVRRLEHELAVLSCVGAEPAQGEDGVAVAVDGVVLAGAGSGGPAPNGAAADVLRLYGSLGDQVAEPLRGEFTLALWDAPRRRGVLVRDQYGVRPLYVAQVDGGVLFASELRAVLASGLVGTTPDYEAIEIFLDLGHVVAPRTLLADVKKLRAGHVLAVEEGRLGAQRPYWAFPRPAPRREAEEETVRRAAAAIDASIAAHAAATERPGVLLSAGLDSALVLALLRRHTDAPILALTAGISGPGAASELGEAGRVASAFGVEHVTATVSLDDPAASLAELVWVTNEPQADLSPLALSALARAAAPGADAVLSGTLADSLFAADSASRRLELVGRLDRLPSPVRRAAGRALRLGPDRVALVGRILAADSAGERYRAQWALDDERRARLVRGPLAELAGSATRDLLSELADGVEGHATETYSYVDQTLCGDWLTGVAAGPAASGPVAFRFPFAGLDVVDAAATVPGSLRVRRGVPKLVLRRIAAGVLPAELLERPKVGFLDTATPDWVRAQLRRGGAELLLDPGARSTDVLERGEVERQVRAALDGGPIGDLFSVLVLEGWLSLYLPRALAGETP